MAMRLCRLGKDSALIIDPPQSLSKMLEIWLSSESESCLLMSPRQRCMRRLPLDGGRPMFSTLISAVQDGPIGAVALSYVHNGCYQEYF